MHVIGTAGHVDHGKSSLVRALTGTDPDRWLEEKLRGMTLDLGFARLLYPDGVAAAIVDVPGHERFVHNMLAGAGGVELLLLVVAANEGPRPQTFEHLAILRYLNVRRTVVALTKSDLLDDDALVAVRERVARALASGVARDAPIVPVSSITGHGLDDLRVALREALDALPPRPIEAPVYLPLDRVFALDGLGTVVTGTLMQGRIALGDRLPAPSVGRDVRVRGLQVFGEKREAVFAGERVALNVVGVDRSELHRGAVLASAQFAQRSAADVVFAIEPDARDLLRRRTPVRAYIGSAEIIGTLVFAQTPGGDEARVSAQLYLREPTVIVPGATFVVRRLSPKTLLGGGTFTSLDERLVADDATVADSSETFALLAALDQIGIAGADAARIGAVANVRDDRAFATLTDLVDAGRAYALEKPRAFASKLAVDAMIERAVAELATQESAAPWRAGTTSVALARSLVEQESTIVRVLGVAVIDARVVLHGGYYATPAFVPQLAPDQRAFFDGLYPADAARTLVPISLADTVARIKGSSIPGLSAAFDTLIARGAMHKVHDAIYRDDQIVKLRTELIAALREMKSITPAAYRDRVGTSRKYVVPLLEWFDASGVTLRSGDARVLRLTRRPEDGSVSDETRGSERET